MQEYKVIPEVIGEREYFPEGANHPTSVKVHKCFCGKGTIEHHTVSGFDDDWFEICCPECDAKYGLILQEGNRWKVSVK